MVFIRYTHSQQIVFELKKIVDLQAFEITVKSEGTVTRTEEQRR